MRSSAPHAPAAKRPERGQGAARRRALLLLAAASATLRPTTSQAAGKQECLEAHTEAQKSRKQGSLRAARAQLLVCNQDGCPGPVAEDCTRWLSELEAELPTLVFAAKDAEGHDTPGVQVWLDGALLLERIDGHPVEVDPGEHRLRYQWPGGQVMERPLVVHAGEKARLVELSLAPVAPPPPAPLEPSVEIPAASWALWGVGALAGGSFAYFAISGRSRESDLARTCGERCAEDAVSEVRARYVLADVSWIAGLAAAGAGTLIALWPEDERPQLGVAPGRASLSLRF